MKKNISLLLAGAALALTATQAQAVRTSGGSFGSTLNGVPAAVNLGAMHSTTYTEFTNTKESVDAIMNSLFARPDKGAMGVKEERRWGLWAGGDWTKIRDKTRGGSWDTHLFSALVGADYYCNQYVTAGLALNYGHFHGDTAFNKGTIRDDAYGVVPYLKVSFLKWLGFDLAGGWSRVNKQRDRVDLTAASGQGRNVYGNVSSDRWFIAPSFRLAYQANEKIGLFGRLGYSYARDNQNAFQESDGSVYGSQKFNLNRLHVKLQMAYQWTDSVKPFIFGLYAHDFTVKSQGLLLESATNLAQGYANPEQHRSKNTWGLGTGVSFLADNNWSGVVSYTFKRNSNVETNGVNMKVRYSF
ncbi:MAG: hypothetical protein C0514_06155 [Candidatus Puniceispirillum sp.]|nr:hypothetical protein [Candidatus Puniceispirillum sp.]MCA0370621.1 autotransporter outer membrane beta-barrel domain-containing protein [Pseudomonadota bacterium]